MGNSVNIRLKEDSTLRITEELVLNFQELICNVDKSMSGFARTIDSLKGTCELLLRKIDQQGTLSQDKGDVSNQNNMVEEAELLVQVLRTIDESVSDQKMSALQSLTKLLHHIIETGKMYVDLPVSNFSRLSLEKYEVDRQMDDTLNLKLPYYKSRVENLREELSCVYDLNNTYKDEVSKLNEKEVNFRHEIEILRKRNKEQEAEIKRLNEEVKQIEERTNEPEAGYETIEKENNTLQTKADTVQETVIELHEKHFGDTAERNKDLDCLEEKHQVERWTFDPTTKEANLKCLNDEIERLKRHCSDLEKNLKKLYSKTCIHVQFLCTITSKHYASSTIEWLKAMIETPDCKLYIIHCNDKDKLNYKFPVVVFSNAHGYLQNKAIDALTGVRVSNKVALVFVHKNVTSTSVRNSGALMVNSDYKTKLGGIFDIIHDFHKGVTACDLNDRNIDGLTEFILKYGVKKTRIETYEIC